jgi:hypothetical protein
MTIKKAMFLACFLLLPTSLLAESYGTGPNPPPAPAPQVQAAAPQQQPQAQAPVAAPSPQCNAAATDPRVPPAGAYKIEHGDGSSEEVYTTGEKKPYYVDNCNNQATPPIMPQVYVQPPVVPSVGSPAVTR